MKIPKNVLDRDYRGCGRAWAAVNEGEIIAITYMEPPLGEISEGLPAWVCAVRDNAEGIDSGMLPVAWSGRGLARIAAAAARCADCPTRARGGRYRPKELLGMARAVIVAADRAHFAAHRTRSRERLAGYGEVISGMCSCTEFVAFESPAKRTEK